MKSGQRSSWVILIGTITSAAGLGLFIYGFASSNPAANPTMTPHFLLCVSGFVSVLLGLALCWSKARQSFLAPLWAFLSWLAIGSAAVVGYLMGIYSANCLSSHGSALSCNPVLLLGELDQESEAQAALELTGVILFGLGQLAVSIALQPKVIFGNPLRRRKTVDALEYSELID